MAQDKRLRYLFRSPLTRHAKEVYGKRLTESFLQMLDAHVEHIVEKACNVHNGSSKTVDAFIGNYIGLNKKNKHNGQDNSC